MKKRILSMLLAIVMVVGLVPGINLTAFAATTTGTTGDCTWTFDDNTGILTISGSGAMEDYASVDAAPWYTHKDSIKDVKIEEDVTSIAAHAFYGYPSLATINIPGSVTHFGRGALQNCPILQNVRYWGKTEPSSVDGNYAFTECSYLWLVHVPTDYQGDDSFLGKFLQKDLVPAVATYTVTVVNGTGGGDFTEGEDVLIMAAEIEGKQFVCWTSEDGVEFYKYNYPNTRFTMPAKNVTVTATYEDIPTYTVSVSASPADGGTVTSGGTYDEGASVTVTATPATGYRFVKWTENGNEVSTDAAYTFTASGDRALVAVFEAIPADPTTAEQLQAAINAGGTVRLGGSIDLGSTKLVFPDNTPVTIDLNSHTLSKSQSGYVLELDTGDDVTITGSGTVSKAGGWYFFKNDSGSLKIEGGIYEKSGYDLVYAAGTAVTEITGGTFALDNIIARQSDESTATIKGGQFTVNNIATGIWDRGTTVTGGTFGIDPSGFVPNTHKATKSGAVWTVGEKPVEYTVTVENGTGGGSYAENATVTITANAPGSGKKFVGWTSEDGVTFAEAAAQTTTFIMPAKAVTVTATYADLLPGKVIVNGVDLVNGDDDHTIDCGSGTAKYDPQTLTLTLTNAQITTPSAPALASCGIYASDLTGDFTIVLIGDNSITLTDKAYDNTGIYRWGSHRMTIQGSGSLSIEIFDDATPQGIGGNNGDIVIKDVTLTFALASGSNTNGYMLHSNKTITIDHANISTTDSGYQQCFVTPATGGILIKNGSFVNISAIENAIYSDGTITIEDSTVTAQTTDYEAICAWGDINVTDSELNAQSKWAFALYCFGKVTVSGGTVNVTTEEADALCAYGGIMVTNNAKVTAKTDAGAAVYTGGIVSVESGELHATGGNWAILARRISKNAQDSKPADSAVALAFSADLLEYSGAEVKTEDWVYTEVWDDWDYAYYDRWMSRSYFTDKDGNKLTSASIVPGYTITFDSAGGSTIDPITQAAGTTVTAPEVPTKPGHIFKKWDKELPSVMPDNDLDLTAIWEVKPNQTFAPGFDTPQDSTYGDVPYTRAVVVTSATPGTVTYTSSDESVATVDAQGKVTILKAGIATITATAAETAANAETSASYTLTVARKAVTVTALDKKAYRGRTAPDLSAPVEGTDYTIEGVVEGDTVVVHLSCYVDMSVSGTYDIVPEVEAPAGKYTFNLVNGTLTVRVLSSISASTTPIISKTTGGAVTCGSVNPARGTQVTFTAKPDAGKVVDTVTVTYGGKEVTATPGANGSYTFYQPAGTATITVTFKDMDAAAHDCPAADFADVDTTKWYHEAIDYVLKNGIMAGYGDGSFGPDDALDRAMVVQVLYNHEKNPGASVTDIFSDVKAGQWYTDAVHWAAQKGIVAGYGNGNFGPQDHVTIEQVAVILWNYAGNPAIGSATLSGVGSYSGWATNALTWAVSNGIFEEMPMANANANATRAQAAQMLKNFMEKAAK